MWDGPGEGSGHADARRFGPGARGDATYGNPDGRFSSGLSGTSGTPQSPRRWSAGGPPRGGGNRYGASEGQPQARWGRSGRPQRPQRPAPPSEPRRSAPPPSVPGGAAIDPFDLFCAYHLGITANGGYHIQNIHEVARRFGTNAATLRQTLAAYGMDAEDLVHGGFDLASAQIDIMVAPEGISRRELARPLYDEFKQAPRKARDWAKEMEDADREIERTIGSEGRWSPSPRRP